MGIEQELQSFSASMSPSSITGETMSPTILKVPAIEPTQLPLSAVGLGGTISATGLPRRVMRKGFLVLRTCSSSARHLALNSEMAISCIGQSSYLTNLDYHSHLYRSTVGNLSGEINFFEFHGY